MSMRIVVGLDASEHCKSALATACMMAKAYSGTVIGVAVVDQPGIEDATAGAGVGASVYAKQSRETLTKRAEEHASQMLEAFEAKCQAEVVSYETENKAGSPEEKLLDASMSADLIIVGTRTFFHSETHDKPGETQRELLEAGVCPVLVVPENMDQPFANLTFPYDASPGAARAMRRLVDMTRDVPTPKEVTLLQVTDNPEEGREILERPTQYLESYGYGVESKVLPGNPKEVVLEVALERMPGTVVLGASGKGTLSRLIFGSVTTKLLEDGSIPLLISA